MICPLSNAFEKILLGLIFLLHVGFLEAQGQSLSVQLTPSSLSGGYAISCASADDGIITSSVSGGTTPYSYLWSNGSTNSDLEGLSSGTYMLVVTDGVGIKDSSEVILSEPNPLSMSFTSVLHNGFNVSCAGGSNGELHASVTGGTAPYFYSWNSGDTVKDLTGLTAGNYLLTVTDANGCTIVKDSNMVAPPVMATTVSAPLTASGFALACAGESDASLNLTVAGGVSPFSYDWSNGQISKNQSSVGKGLYVVRVTGSNGCVKYDSLEIQEPQLLEVSMLAFEYEPGKFFSCNECNDGRASLSVSGGTAPYTYLWSTGATVDSVYDLAAGQWHVYTVTDAAGCLFVDSVLLNANVTVDPLSVVGTISSYAGGYNVSTFGGSDGAIDIDVIGGLAPFTYSWSNGATVQDITGLTSGSYTVTVTDANTDVVSKTFSLIQPAAPLSVSISINENPSCAGFSDGELEALVSGGTPPYSYQWSAGGTNIRSQNLAAGNYALTVWDANNDTIIESIELTGPLPLTTSIVPSYNQGGYQFQCFGDTTQLNLSVAGGMPPYDYLWDNGKFSKDVNVNSQGWYSVRVTGANGCVKQDSILVSSPAPIMNIGAEWFTYPNGELFSCDTCNDFKVTWILEGGMEPYLVTAFSSGGSHLISGPAFENGYADTVYSFRVEDGLGCIIDPFGEPTSIPRAGFSSLQVSGSLSSYPGGYNVSTNGGNNGAIDLSISGMMSEPTISWTDGSTEYNRSSLTAGFYEVTVRDDAGQSVTKSWTLTEPANNISVSIGNQTSGCGSSVYLEAYVNGGTPPYIYIWSNQDGMPVGDNYSYVSGSGEMYGEGIYTVQVIDANSDTSSTTYHLLFNSLNVSLSSPLINGYNVSCEDGDGTIIVSITGGEIPYQIRVEGNESGYNEQFTVSDTTVFQIDSLEADEYWIEVSGANGCQTNQSIILGPQPLDIIPDWYTYPNGQLFSCDTCNDAQLVMSFMGGVPPFSTTLSSATQTLSGPTFSGIYADTSYALRVEDARGCVIEFSGDEGLTIPRGGFNSLDISSQLSQYPGGYNISTTGGSDGWIEFNIHGEMSQPTIVWEDGYSGDFRENLSAGTYEVTVSDDAGQSITKSWTLTEPANNVSVSIGNQTYGCGSSVYLEAYVNGGTPPYTYNWSNQDGMSIGDNYSYVSGSGDMYQEGIYTVQVIDANGDSTSAQFNLTFESFNISVSSPIIAGTYNVGCDGNDGSIVIQVNGGMSPYGVVVDNYDGYRNVFSTGDTLIVIDSLEAEYYYVSVTDMMMCQTDQGLTLNEVPEPDFDIDWLIHPNGELFSCDSCNDAQVTINITGELEPYTLSLETSSQTLFGPVFSGLFADTVYAMRLIDNSGCEDFIADEGLMVPRDGSNLQVVVEKSNYAGGYNVSSHNGTDGWINLDITGLLSSPIISWSDDPTITDDDRYDLGAGTYEVTVSDEAGQSVTKFIVLTEPQNSLNATVVNTSDSCSSEANLQAFVVGGVPPYNYLWEDANGNFLNEGWSYLNAYSEYGEGEYKVHVTDAAGDSILVVTDVTFNSLRFYLSSPVVTGSFNVSCAGNDGEIRINFTDGLPPFDISVSNYNGYYNAFNIADTAFTLGGLPQGYYNVQSVGSRGCEYSRGINLSGPDSVLVNLSFNEYTNGEIFSCDSCHDAVAELNITGGVEPYTVLWSNGETGTINPGIHADSTIWYTVTDFLGCTNTDTLYVTRETVSGIQLFTELSQYAGGYNVSSLISEDGYINLTIIGGMSPYEVRWYRYDEMMAHYYEMMEHNGQMSASNLGVGEYEIRVTDMNGEEKVKWVRLTGPANVLAVSINNQSEACSSQAYLVAYVNGGVPPYTYQWKDQWGMEISSWSYLNAWGSGEYVVQVVDANGQGGSDTIQVETTQFSVSVSSLNQNGTYNVTCAGSDGEIQIAFNGGTAPYQVTVDNYQGYSNSFSTNDSIVGIDSLEAKYYNINVTDMNGCSSSNGISLNAPAPITVGISFQDYGDGEIFSCDSCQDAIVTLNISGGIEPYSVSWSSGQTGNSHTSTYSDSLLVYTVTDFLGCAFVDSIRLSREMTSGLQVLAELSQYPGGYNVSAANANDGSISLMVIGGQPPVNTTWYYYDTMMMYEYEMMEHNGKTSVSNLSSGQYRVVVSDMMNEVEKNVILTAPRDSLIADIQGNYRACDNYGHLNVYVNGGTPSYNYQWFLNGMPTGGGWSYLDIYQTGIYGVAVTDMNGDSTYATIAFSEEDAFYAEATSPMIYQDQYNTNCDGKDGSIEIRFYGGSAPYSIDLNFRDFDKDKMNRVVSEHDAASDMSPLAGMGGHQHFTTHDSVLVIDSLLAGYYDINVHDMSGCNQYFGIEISKPEGLVVNAIPSKLPNGYYFSCDTCNDGVVNPSVLDGISPYSYRWFVVPEELLQGARLEGVSIFTGSLLNLVSEDMDFNDPMVQQFVVSTDSLLTNVEPEKAYVLQATDNSGCQGITGFYLERPKPNPCCDGNGTSTPTAFTCNDTTEALRGRWVNDTSIVHVCEGIQVGIGTDNIPSDASLAVVGKIMAEEVEVQLQGNWPDYVFEDDYSLRTIGEVEAFVKQNGHLPEVPSSESVEKDGISLGEMDAILLRKIEELTLYMIDMKKENDLLKEKLDQLRK